VRQGQHDEALATLEQVNDVSVATMRILEAYGDVYLAQGKESEALGKYNEAANVTDLPQVYRDELNKQIAKISLK